MCCKPSIGPAVGRSASDAAASSLETSAGGDWHGSLPQHLNTRVSEDMLGLEDYQEHLTFLEKTNICPSYTLSDKGGLTPAGRGALVNWMAGTCESLGCCTDALFMGVAVLDRWLAKVGPSTVSPDQLAITTCACLLLGVKMEATTRPPLSAFTRYLAGSYTIQQLHQAEVDVLQALDYRIANIPTTCAFLTSFWFQADTSAAHCQLAFYLAELALLEYSLLPLPPSKLAAACLAYASILMQQPQSQAFLCDAGFQQLTGYTLEQVAHIIAHLSAVHCTVTAAAVNGRAYAATTKYLSSKYGAVAVCRPLLLASCSQWPC